MPKRRAHRAVGGGVGGVGAGVGGTAAVATVAATAPEVASEATPSPSAERQARDQRPAAEVLGVPRALLGREEPTTVSVWSATRHRLESVEVEPRGPGTFDVRSESGRMYRVQQTTQIMEPTGQPAYTCTCPDFQYRSSSDHVCRHIRAVRASQEQAGSGAAPGRVEAPPAATPAPEEVRPPVRPTAASATVRERERAAGSAEAHGWVAQARSVADVRLSEFSRERLVEHFRSLPRPEVGREVIGDPDATFGLEIETVFPSFDAMDEALHALYREGLTASAQQQGYHTAQHAQERNTPYDRWSPERDGSLGSTGTEFVSPIMHDRAEDWERLVALTRIIRAHGGTVNDRTGGHIHVSNTMLDTTPYAWKRFAQIALGYQDVWYALARRVGSDHYRGTAYAQPSRSSIPRVRRNAPEEDEVMRIRRALDTSGHYSAISTRSVVPHSPTVEFRVWDGSLDPAELQARVLLSYAAVANAVRLTRDVQEQEGRVLPTTSVSTAQVLDVTRRLTSGLGSMTDIMAPERVAAFYDTLLYNADQKARAGWLYGWALGGASDISRPAQRP